MHVLSNSDRLSVLGKNNFFAEENGILRMKSDIWSLQIYFFSVLANSVFRYINWEHSLYYLSLFFFAIVDLFFGTLATSTSIFLSLKYIQGRFNSFYLPRLALKCPKKCRLRVSQKSKILSFSAHDYLKWLFTGKASFLFFFFFFNQITWDKMLGNVLDILSSLPK